MPAPVFLSVYTGSHLYKMGRVGFDSGNQDAGGNYTATFRTEKISPMNFDGVMLFRRILLRIYRTSPFVLTLTAYVDGTQTLTYDANGNLQLQSVVFNLAAPTTSPDKTLIEMAVAARGTYIELEGTVVSNTINGIFLPEEVEIHYDPLRTARAGAVAQTS
jgi:hypothetical protein